MTNSEPKDADGKHHVLATMVKEATVKDDGRFLVYYSFPEKVDAGKAKTDQEHENV